MCKFKRPFWKYHLKIYSTNILSEKTKQWEKYLIIQFKEYLVRLIAILAIAQNIQISLRK